MEHRKVMIDTEKCIGCGMCAKVCVAQNITINNNECEEILQKIIEGFQECRNVFTAIADLINLIYKSIQQISS